MALWRPDHRSILPSHRRADAEGFSQIKAGFSPDFRKSERPASALAASKHSAAGAWFSLCSPPHVPPWGLGCCSQPYRGSLTYSLLVEALQWQFQVLDGPNFRAPLSPRCTALSVASCGNHGAALNSGPGTRVPGNLGGKSFVQRIVQPHGTIPRMEPSSIPTIKHESVALPQILAKRKPR